MAPAHTVAFYPRNVLIVLKTGSFSHTLLFLAWVDVDAGYAMPAFVFTGYKFSPSVSYHAVLNMQSVLIIQCFICTVSLSCSALYEKCHYYVVLYMQSVSIIQCFICTMILLFSALYTKCPYYSELYMEMPLIFSTLYAKCPCHSVLYMQISLSFSALHAKCPY